MKLNVTIELEDLYINEETPLEEILTSEVKNAVVREVSKKIAGKGIEEVAIRLSEQVEKQITAHIQEKAESFMSEDITLTDRWGKVTFIGSIEDFMKLKFDEAVLHPVNNNGEALKMCTTSGAPTWVQWRIEQLLQKRTEAETSAAKSQIERSINTHISEVLEEYKTTTIKAEVSKVIDGLLKPAA